MGIGEIGLIGHAGLVCWPIKNREKHPALSPNLGPVLICSLTFGMMAMWLEQLFCMKEPELAHGLYADKLFI